MKRYISTLLTLLIFAHATSAYARTPNDHFFDEQWYLNQISALRAWDSNTGSPDVVVAILDTGVDLEHDDLKGQIFVNKGEVPGDGIDNDNNGYTDDVFGWDFFDNDNDANPVSVSTAEFGVHHGTVVAGVIGATGNNSLGVAGVNWNVGILPLRVLDSAGNGEVGNIVKGIDYAIAMGADVINLSFVGNNNPRSLDQALQRAYDNGVVVVAAMGNLTDIGTDLDRTPMYPACSVGTGDDDVVIGVVATDDSDRRAIFSNYGSDCADISAPGTSMYTTQVNGYSGGWNGTSLAAPLVSGAVAMLRSIFPKATPTEILLTLKLSVDPVVGRAPSGQPGALGTGRLNLARAIEMLPKLVADQSGRAIAPVVTPQPILGELDSATQSTQPRAQAQLIPIAVSASSGDKPLVTVFDAKGEVASFLAYAEAFRGGVSVAVGQLDGDSKFEVVTGAGPGGGPHVRVFNSIGALKAQFFAFPTSFSGGIDVATGDMTGDGVDEIIVVPGKGTSAVARVFELNGTLIKEIPLKSSGGALSVSAGDIDGDGVDDIVVTEGEGSAPVVRVYNMESKVISEFSVYASNMLKGVKSSVVMRSGKANIVVGTGAGAGPHVRTFDRIGALVTQFFAFDSGDRNGVDVSSWQPYNDGQWFSVTSSIVNGVPNIRVYDVQGALSNITLTLSGYTKKVNL